MLSASSPTDNLASPAQTDWPSRSLISGFASISWPTLPVASPAALVPTSAFDFYLFDDFLADYARGKSGCIRTNVPFRLRLCAAVLSAPMPACDLASSALDRLAVSISDLEVRFNLLADCALGKSGRARTDVCI